MALDRKLSESEKNQNKIIILVGCYKPSEVLSRPFKGSSLVPGAVAETLAAELCCCFMRGDGWC
jgi:hypothetical protein